VSTANITILQSTPYVIDLTSSTYDDSTYYPVVGNPLPYRGYEHIKCAEALNSGSKPSWSSHGSGFTAMLELLVTAAGWGTTAGESLVIHNYHSWTNNDIHPIGYMQMSNSSRPVFWLRGGGKYHIHTSYSSEWSVKTSSYTVSSQTITPQTSYPGINYYKSISEGSIFITGGKPHSLGPYTIYNTGTRF
jgi:hypothetical protein